MPIAPLARCFFIRRGVWVLQIPWAYSWLPWKVYELTPAPPKWDIFKVILLFIYSCIYSLIYLTNIYWVPTMCQGDYLSSAKFWDSSKVRVNFFYEIVTITVLIQAFVFSSSLGKAREWRMGEDMSEHFHTFKLLCIWLYERATDRVWHGDVTGYFK